MKYLYAFVEGDVEFKFLFNNAKRLKKHNNKKIIKIITKPIITLVAQFATSIIPDSLK